MSLRNRLSDERGWALITAILLMTIMLGTVLSVASYVDGQTRMGANSRKRETAFNITESALNAQIFALSQDWPGTGNAGTPYPTCTQASSGTRCPNASALSALIASPDSTGATWQTVVRDDGGSAPNFYSDAATLSQPAYDANGNGKVWIRATATARGKTRTMVTLVRVEEQAEDIPHAAVIAGRMNNSNNGNKVLEDLSASTGANGFIGVRCTPTLGESTACLGQPWSGGTFPDSRVLTQIAPYSGHIQTGYSSAPIVNAAARARLKARAIADGTYYASCPPTLPSGDIIWIESGDCTATGGAGTATMLIINNGTYSLNGNATFYGVIYAINAQNSSGIVVSVHGNATVTGGVLIDGNGMFDAGSSKENLVFDDNAYGAVKSYGTAGMIQNTWRELK
jgi:Tfp pilus assembly protein PilX